MSQTLATEQLPQASTEVKAPAALPDSANYLEESANAEPTVTMSPVDSSYLVSHLVINHQVYTLAQMQAPREERVGESGKEQGGLKDIKWQCTGKQGYHVPQKSLCAQKPQGACGSQVTQESQEPPLPQTEEAPSVQTQPAASVSQDNKSWLQKHFVQMYGPESFAVKVADFLAEWFSADPYITVQTSGSTGTPKHMRVSKERMCNSARMTVKFLGLKAQDKAHLCMPMQYIAGKMVVVRALVAKLNLIIVEPSGRPLQALAQELVNAKQERGDRSTCAVDFAPSMAEAIRLASPEFSAMIPMQVFNTLHAVQTVEQTEFASLADKELALQVASCEVALLKGIKQLIIGGGSVDESLAQQLKVFPHAVWSTYGMTETLSHIALRRLSGAASSVWYTPFQHVQLSLSKEHTLVIDAPLVAAEVLATNDIVEFNEQGQFKILGRKDNTINTGGVKVQIEQVEAALKALAHTQQGEYGQDRGQVAEAQTQADTATVHTNSATDLGLDWPFMISYVKDVKFGQKVVLLLECPALTAEEWNKVKRTLMSLPLYWQPKLIFLVSALPQTGSGKPNRAGAVSLLQDFLVQDKSSLGNLIKDLDSVEAMQTPRVLEVLKI